MVKVVKINSKNIVKMTNLPLLLLPNEIIIYILNYCSFKSLSALNQTCKKLQELTNQESLWSHICYRDYGVTNKGKSFHSFSELYKIFLSRYGYMLGTYMIGVPFYGGFAEIEFQDGLVVSQLKQSLFLLEKPLAKVTLFLIPKPSKENEEQIICPKDPGHEIFLVKNGRNFAFKCRDSGMHFPVSHEICFSNVFLFCEVEEEGLNFYPIQIPGPLDVPNFLLTEMNRLPDWLIEPGLFRVISYAKDDTIIVFNYRYDGTLFGFMVATDGFSATKKSIRVNVTRSLCPSLEQQSSGVTLLSFSEGNYQSEIPKEHEVFMSPQFKISESLKPALRRCKARFLGFGKLQQEIFEKIHFIVFSNDIVGILFLEKFTLRIFKRETQTFTEKKKRDGCIFINT